MAGRASKKDAHTFFEVVTFFAFCVVGFDEFTAPVADSSLCCSGSSHSICFYLCPPTTMCFPHSVSRNDQFLVMPYRSLYTVAGSSDVPGLGIQTNPLPNQRTSILKSVLSKVVNALPAVGRKGSKTSRSQLDGLISPAHSAPPSPIPWAPKEPNQQHTYPSYFSSAPNSTESQRLSPQPPSSSRFPDRLAPTSPMLGGAAGVPPRRVASDANLRQANAAITSPQLQGRRSVQSTEDDSFVDTPIWGDYGKKAD